MNQPAAHAFTSLNLEFFLNYPREAARRLETMLIEDASHIISEQPMHAVLPVWQNLASDVEQILFTALPEPFAIQLLTELEPTQSATLLSRLDEAERQRFLELLNKQVAAEIKAMMEYPVDSAGRLMDPRVIAFSADLTAYEALERLRKSKLRGIHELYLLDEQDRLQNRVDIQDIALAEPTTTLSSIARNIVDVVHDIASQEEVIEKMQQQEVTDLPVIDYSGKLLGVIYQSKLAVAMEQESTLDMQMMVGASRDEGALSSATFAVRKRLPWLQINLLTAFLAASVVSLFEGTIAKYTALAVLLPVVAGQSGNAGAQALAVTMRGLVLREISVRHWTKVVLKELNTGLLNGIAVAATTAIGVYFWSKSIGLVLVIVLSMIISMVAAGFAGALIPIVLKKIGQDPATSSSIILTTVTDVVGFFSFLGIATALSSMLPT